MNTVEKKKLSIGSALMVICLFISAYSCLAQSIAQIEESKNNLNGDKGVLVLSNVPTQVAYSTDPDEQLDSIAQINGRIIYRVGVPYLLLNKQEGIKWADISLHNDEGYFIDQIFLSSLPPDCTQIKVNLKDKNLEGQSCFVRVKFDDRTRYFSILTR